MSFRRWYNEIVEMIHRAALDADFARDLVRKSGVRAGLGAGVPPGGYEGQALKKSSDVDGDTHWGQPGPRSVSQAYMLGAAPTIANNWCQVNNGFISGTDPGSAPGNGFDFNPVGSGPGNDTDQNPILDMCRFLGPKEARLVLYCTAPIGVGGYAKVPDTPLLNWPSGSPMVEMETTGLKVSDWKPVSLDAFEFNDNYTFPVQVGFLDGTDAVADIMIGVPFYQVQFRSFWSGLEELYTQGRFPDSPGGSET